MITVNKMNKRFALKIEEGEDCLLLVFSQLDYFSRNKVATLSTTTKKGKLMLDLGLACFYNIKFGLKEVRGLVGEDGEAYALEFEGEGDEAMLTDSCVNELLSCSIESKLIYAARDLGNNIPTEIVDPVTSEPIEGLSIIPPKELKAALEKK